MIIHKIIMVIWVKIIHNFILWDKINHMEDKDLVKHIIVNKDKIDLIINKEWIYKIYNNNKVNIYIKIQDNPLILNLIKII